MANGKTGTRRARTTNGGKAAETYKHPTSESPMRPEVGTQAQFKKKLPPKTYRYDSSLSPALDWDGQNPAREHGEARIAAAEAELAAAAQRSGALDGVLKAAGLSGSPIAETADGVRQHLVAAQSAVRELKTISKPFLNWTGKAERLSFDVPTLPLFVHERLSTKAILETLKGHKRDKQIDMFDLFGDPQHSITDQVLRAYEYQDKWVNRMILGDSLVVMNSLLHYEGLGGQVQMIYIDPPYGVRFGSNFQPFIRKRDVSHNDDEDMTREPEMVQAYRDTWELNLHSYLTYLRDRLFLARELLTPSGSVFVQISDTNLHHVRELIDEVFGGDHACGVIAFSKTTGATSDLLPTTTDFLLWYARDITRIKYRQLYLSKAFGAEGASAYSRVTFADGTRRAMTAAEKADPSILPADARIYRIDNLTSQRPPGDFPVEFDGKIYRPRRGYWKTGEPGMASLVAARRLEATERGLYYVRYLDDFPVYPLTNSWNDTSIAGFASDKLYVVQTTPKVVQRCILMTTDPGDLVLDPTCGSGTTAYCAETWGRRWITCDTSRVPLALARQRLLTATYPYYELADESRGPASGFVYKRKQNNKGEEVGGIVPHVTLKSIANNEPPDEEVLVDRPETLSSIVRVTGPFCVEATIPTPTDFEETKTEQETGASQDVYGSFVERMLEVLRKSPVLRLEGNKTVTLKNVRPPAKTLSLSAEAIVVGGNGNGGSNGKSLIEAVVEAAEASGKALPFSQKPVALVFGPENGAVSEKLVYEAAREAHAKNYAHLYVIGFAIQPNARQLIEKSAEIVGVPATYVQATPDLMMGDLLKNMRSSQIFSVCGLPEAAIRKIKGKDKSQPQQYDVALLGFDVFDPVTMDVEHLPAEDVPAWFLDTSYNGLCFHVTQAFFPRTGAWENLKKALKGEYEEGVWEHLAGTVSAPFDAGEHSQIAVKVIDMRGNELLVIKNLREAK